MASLLLSDNVAIEHRPARAASLRLTGVRLRAEQRVAAAVIAQAVSDATNQAVPAAYRERARAFLLRPTSTGLQFWCAVAGLDCEVVRQRARRVVVDGPL